MAKLEIRTPDGRAEVRPLSRRNPVVVGRNPISDIPIDDESVAAIHCRLSWNGKAYEVAAAAADGVDVNGVLVRRKELTDGDVIRIGEFDLVLLNGEPSDGRTDADAPGPFKEFKPAARPYVPAENDEELEIVYKDELKIPVVEPGARPSEPGPAPRAGDGGPEVELPVIPVTPEPKQKLKPGKEKPARTAGPTGLRGLLAQLRRRRRPGDQDPLSSPLVLGLGGLALVLVLAAAAIWFLIGREGADRLYETASGHRESRRYSEAIEAFEQFLKEYPGDSRAAEARYELGRTRVERFTAGGSPDWNKAIAEFDLFARASRDESDFDARRGELLKLAEAIASGAAAEATRTGDRESLAAAEEGRKLFDRYSRADGSTDSIRTRLAGAYAAAEAAVRKREYFDAAAKTIEAALAKPDLDLAFETRSNLLTRYRDLASNKKVQTLLASTLEAERKLVRPGEVKDLKPAADRPIGEPEAATTILTLIGHTQARAGEVSDGRLVFAVARDAIIGLDAVTGRPRWRRAIGLDTPFFPAEVDAEEPAILAFDASRKDLILLARDDGAALWKAHVGADAAGPPLVAQGQVDLATSDGRLLRFALDDGRPLAAVTFPQGVVGPPVVAEGGERLVLFGDRATAYTLDLRSLAVQAVSFTGHAAGTIDAPPSALGRLIVLCENARIDSAVAKAFLVDPAAGTLRQVASERIEGVTRQPPVARGNVLFVPSFPERVTAFSVSDDPAQPPLSRLSGLQIPDAKDVPTFLVAGPEGMLWQAGSALRKLRLAPDGLELLPGVVAPGRHTQPPQESGDSLFVARSLASSPAVYVSQADREAMAGSWRTVAGASVLATANGPGGATAVTDAGQSAVIGSGREGGFVDMKPLSRWEEAEAAPLRATTLHDGRAAAWRGGASPLLWLVRAGDAPAQPRTLEAAPECAPVALDAGIVLPLPGRLEWLPEAGGTAAQAYLLPVGGPDEPKPKWKHAVRLDGERLAVADDAGTLRVIALRNEPLPHLAEVASAALGDATARPIAASDGRIIVTADRRVRLLDPAGLRPVAEAETGAVTGGPWGEDGMVFAQTGDAFLALAGSDLTARWSISLDAAVAGRPTRTNTGWIVASQTGTVVTIGDDGAERSRSNFTESLTGLHRVGDALFAATLGGSLFPLPDSALDASPREGAAP